VRGRENQTAVKMIAGLSDLLRHSLQNAGLQEVPFREELEFIEGYLGIQQQRFSDRLRIEMKIAPETLGASVPNMILQPLVENAIQYGVARRQGGRVEIRATRENGSLQIQVYNDGAGLPPGWRPAESEGIGLSNTKARLRRLYGDVCHFEVGNAEAGGVLAEILIPWRQSAESASKNE
jgi:sensor histidine kinase YesM